MDSITQNKRADHKAHQQDAFIQELWTINYFRIRSMMILLSLLFFILGSINFIFQVVPEIALIYPMMGVGSLLYWCVSLLLERLGYGHKVQWQALIVLSYSFFVIVGFGLMSTLLPDRDSILYMLPVFSVGIFFIMTPKVSSLFFVTTHFVFITIYTILVSSPYLFVKNIVNASVAMILALAVNYFSYQLLQKEFRQQMMAKEHSTALKEANQQLAEDNVKHKEMEMALRKSEERLQYFFSQSLDGCFFMMLDEPLVWDESIDKEATLDYVFHNQHMTKVNQAMLHQYGAEEDDFIGSTPYDLFKHDLDHGRSIWRGLFDQGRWHVVTNERRFDGSPMWIDGDYICMYDDKGRIIGHFGVQTDITEKKEMEDALRESEERFRALYENSPVSILIHDKDTGEIIDANDTAYRSYGFSSLEELQKNPFLLHPPYAEDDALAWIHKTVVEGPQVFEWKSCRVNGDIFWEQVRLTSITINGNARILATSIDITERIHIEEALRESEERFRISVEQSKDAIMTLVPPDWRYDSANPATLDLFGAPDEETFTLLGPLDVSPLTQPDGQPSSHRAKEMIEKAMERGFYSFEWVHQRMDGTEFLATVLLSKLQIGGQVSLQAIVRDITQQKEAEREIQYLSFHDTLTGLYNRRFFEEELHRLDVMRNLPLTLLLIDVNGLKLINDAFGHRVGDQMLIKVARVLKRVCRADDIIARIGGDEFAILLPKTNEDHTYQLSKRIKQDLADEKVESLPLSVACGWGTKNEKKERMADVFKKAEDNMYREKISERSRLRHQSIQLIVQRLFEEVPEEERHSKQLGQLCKEIGIAMGLSQIEVNEISIAARFHDIGKVGINKDLLTKEGSLNTSEWNEIRRHPEISYTILSSVNDYASLAEYVHTHHERWDGLGYPRGLKGKKIPLPARIIAIADTYDAMTNHRPYRKKMSTAEALKEIEACAGSQFDPEVVKVFLALLEEKELNRSY